jgi:hypothetical protein
MDLTITMAKVFGIYFVVAGVAVLFRKKTLAYVVKDFFDHPAILWLAGINMVFFGGFLVIKHNIWQGTLETWVTVFGWLILAKGVAYMFFPDQLIKFGNKLRTWYAPLALLMVILGVWMFMTAS